MINPIYELLVAMVLAITTMLSPSSYPNDTVRAFPVVANSISSTPSVARADDRNWVAVGSELVCNPGVFMTDSDDWRFEYRWGKIKLDEATNELSFEAIPGHSSDTLTVTSDHIYMNGESLGCQVQVIDSATGEVMGESPFSSSSSPKPLLSENIVTVSPDFDVLPDTLVSGFRVVKTSRPNTESFRIGDTLQCEPIGFGNSVNTSYLRVEYEWQWFTDINNEGSMQTQHGELLATNWSMYGNVLACNATVHDDINHNSSTNNHESSASSSIISLAGPYYLTSDTRLVPQGHLTVGNTVKCETVVPKSKLAYDRYLYLFYRTSDLRDAMANGVTPEEFLGDIDITDPNFDVTTLVNPSYVIQEKDIQEGTALGCIIIAELDDNPNDPNSTIRSEVMPLSPLLFTSEPQHPTSVGIKGLSQVGKTLTCEAAGWTAIGGVNSIEWLREGVVVQQGEDYLLTSEDLDKRISCRSVLELPLSGRYEKTSTQTSPVEQIVTNTTLTIVETHPAIKGDPTEGLSLVCSIGADLTTLTNVLLSYSWLINGNQAGSGEQFTLKAEHIGKKVVCQIELVSDQLKLTAKTNEFVIKSASTEDGSHTQRNGLRDCAPTNDLLIGTNQNDIICGGAGNDIIYGRGGSDTIYGGPGNDKICGGAGNDIIYSQQGNDTIYGGPGNDKIYGGAGNDYIIAGRGNDHIHGGPGLDVIYGNSGNDKIHAGSGNDLVYGGPGNDKIYGGSSHDVVYGGPGNDFVYGGKGNDLLFGSAGNDRLVGRHGSNILWGNSGRDILVTGSKDILRGFNKQDKQIRVK